MTPEFIIYGYERRREKQRLSKMKYQLKMFWHFEDIHRIYGSGKPDEEALRIHSLLSKEIVELEEKLSRRTHHQ